jgi:hypothetical protein
VIENLEEVCDFFDEHGINQGIAYERNDVERAHNFRFDIEFYNGSGLTEKQEIRAAVANAAAEL